MEVFVSSSEELRAARTKLCLALQHLGDLQELYHLVQALYLMPSQHQHLKERLRIARVYHDSKLVSEFMALKDWEQSVPKQAGKEVVEIQLEMAALGKIQSSF
jgi:hypothetical protein